MKSFTTKDNSEQQIMAANYQYNNNTNTGVKCHILIQDNTRGLQISF